MWFLLTVGCFTHMDRSAFQHRPRASACFEKGRGQTCSWKVIFRSDGTMMQPSFFSSWQFLKCLFLLIEHGPSLKDRRLCVFCPVRICQKSWTEPSYVSCSISLHTVSDCSSAQPKTSSAHIKEKFSCDGDRPGSSVEPNRGGSVSWKSTMTAQTLRLSPSCHHYSMLMWWAPLELTLEQQLPVSWANSTPKHYSWLKKWAEN